MLSAKEIDVYIRFARGYEEAQRSVDEDVTPYLSITATTISSLGFAHDATCNATSFTPDPHGASIAEAQLYYADLHSEPVLLQQTGKEQVVSATGTRGSAPFKGAM